VSAAPLVLRYGSHASQFGELHLPGGAVSGGSVSGGRSSGAPISGVTVVLIHGGFWRDRYDLHLMDGLALDLAARGIAAWNIEYRRVGDDGGGWPATGDDVAAAIDHLAAVDVPLDLDRVGVVGHSAGGHLALWALGRPSARVPVSVGVALAGVVDLAEAAWRGLGGGAVLELLGAAPEDAPGTYAQASPSQRLPTGRPTLLVHGDADDRVPVDLSVDFHARARMEGDPADLVVLGDADHFAVIDPASPAWHVVVAWLTSHL